MAQLDADADLVAWKEGMHLYENDDYSSMMRSADLLARALAHSLYGPGILHGTDLPETTHHVLFASLSAPPDGQTFAESAQRAARLALTIIRENGWQPPRYGGHRSTEPFEPIITDRGNWMLLTAALAPTNRPWEGDLGKFFAVPPQPVAVALAEPEYPVVDRIYETMERAEGGDEASQRHMRGLALGMEGDFEGALAALTEAARLGSTDAMKDAGDAANRLGKVDEAHHWYESAAEAGNAEAMYNLGNASVRAGEVETAAEWYERAAEAGHVEGYAALSSLAFERGDHAQERHWAQLGAQGGFTWCMQRYGTILAKEADGDTATLREAAAYLEAAADRGDPDSIGMAAAVNAMLGDNDRARMWATRGRETGNAELIARLDRNGF